MRCHDLSHRCREQGVGAGCGVKDTQMGCTLTLALTLPPPGLSLLTGATGKGGVISVNYDGFIDDVSVGDELLVDGGIMSFVVRGKTDTDVQVGGGCVECVHDNPPKRVAPPQELGGGGRANRGRAFLGSEARATQRVLSDNTANCMHPTSNSPHSLCVCVNC